MLAQHEIISDIDSHLQDSEKLVLAQWLLINFHNQSLSSSTSLVFLTVCLLRPLVITKEAQSLTLVMPVACCWLRSQSRQLVKLVEKALINEAVSYSSIISLHGFFSTSRLILSIRCNEDFVEAFISPLRQCISKLAVDFQPKGSAVHTIFYIINCAYETVTSAVGISRLPVLPSRLYSSAERPQQQHLADLFNVLKLSKISEMFALKNEACEENSEVWTPVTSILFQLSSAMHAKGSSVMSPYIVKVLKYTKKYVRITFT